MAEEQEIVNLDTLNAKQIAKEFKATQKDVKSKDLAIQQAALGKISSNSRYFVEGACLVPLINSITTKKKLVDVSKGAVEKLSQFLQLNLSLAETPSEEPSVQAQAINAAFKEPQTLEFLQPLLEVFSFKEAYKKPKSPKKVKPKKGELVPEPTEEELLKAEQLEEQLEILAETDDTKYLRLFTLKSLYHLSLSLASADCKKKKSTTTATAEPTATLTSLGSVQGLYNKLSDILADLVRKLSVSYRLVDGDKASADKLREECLQEGTYVLSLLALILRANGKADEGDAIDSLISNSTVLSHIQTLTKESSLRYLCVDIYEVLSAHRTGIVECFSTPGTIEYLIGTYEVAIVSHNSIAESEAAKEAASDTKGKKPDKKVAKGRGAAEEEAHVLPPMEERLDVVKFDARRISCGLIKQMCKIVSRVSASKNAKLINGPTCLRLVTLLTPLATDVVLRNVSQQSPTHPLDVAVEDVLEEVSITLGSLCCISEETRTAVCANGGLYALFTLLKESRAIVASDIELPPEVDHKAAKAKAPKGGKEAPPEADLPALAPLDEKRGGKLQVLRRVAEKAIMHAITKVKKEVSVLLTLAEEEGEGDSKDTSSSTVGAVPTDTLTITTPGQRWPQLTSHSIDNSLFIDPPVEGSSSDVGTCTRVTKSIIDLIAATNDVNLADRGNRLLSTLLLTASSPSTLIAEAGIEAAVMSHLTKLINARGQSITADLYAQKIALLEEMKAIKSASASASTTAAVNGEGGGEGEGECKGQSSAKDSAVMEVVDGAADVTFASEEVKEGSDEPAPPTLDGPTTEDTIPSKESVAEVEEEAPVVIDDLLLASPTESLYTAYALLELILKLDSSVIESLGVFVTAEGLGVVAGLIELLGPCGGDTEDFDASTWKMQERRTKLYDPRMCAWRKASEDGAITVDTVLVRPIILDVLSSIAVADKKYRVYTVEGPVPPMPPCEPLPESQSPAETASLLVCKHCSDIVFSLLTNETKYKFFDPSPSTPSSSGDKGGETQEARLVASLTASPVQSTTSNGTGSKLHVSVLDSALQFIIASASCGVLGVVATVEAVALAGFPGTVTEAGGKPYALRSLSGFLSENGEPTLAEGWTWTRPQFFDDVFKPSPMAATEEPSVIPPSLALITNKSEIYSNPDVWPFVAILSGILSTLGDPTSTKKSAKLAVEALIGLTKSPLFMDHSQPALYDILSATFLSLGGAVVLTGLVGRFGNTEDSFKEEAVKYMAYLFDRGHIRSTFWQQWAEDHKEVIELDPKTGKPIKKKEEKKDVKKDVKKDPKAVVVTPVIAEVMYNLVSNEATPDPNRGPNSALWTKLLEISLEDRHSHKLVSTPLISSIQGALGSVVNQLTDRGVDVNQADEQGLTAVMYTLLLGDSDVLRYLFTRAKQTVDVNKVDTLGNPVAKFALLSLSNTDVTSHLPSHLVLPVAEVVSEAHTTTTTTTTTTKPETEPIALFGYTTLLPLLIELNAQQCASDADNMLDVNVCDSSGFNPLLLVVGLGYLDVKIGGYSLKICSASYNSAEYELSSTHTTVAILLGQGCLVNSCSRTGVAALHIAAGRGDKKLVEILLKKSAHPNAVDSDGFLPIHYLAASCPEEAVELFDYLMEHSILRPVEPMSFQDFRTGQRAAVKNPIDFDAFVQSAFATSYVPSSIGKRRLSYAELLRIKDKQGMNILQLCLSSGTLFSAKDSHITLSPLMKGSKMDRLTLAIHLAECGAREGGNASSLLTNIDDYGFSVLHAASLLCQGITPRRTLTAAETRSKRVKTYPSKEDHIFDLIFAAGTKGLTTKTALDSASTINSSSSTIQETVDCKASTTRTVTMQVNQATQPLCSAWTAMHAAIVNGNPNLASLLIDQGYDVGEGSRKLVHFMATLTTELDSEVAAVILSLCSASGEYKALLNQPESELKPGRPLHLAVRSKKLALLNGLLNIKKVDINAIDELTGHTALHEACISGSVELVSAFKAVSARLDLLVEGPDGRTCVEEVVSSGNMHILIELITMRKNDVIERLLSKKSGGDSLLMSLEREFLVTAEQIIDPAVESRLKGIMGGADSDDHDKVTMGVQDLAIGAADHPEGAEEGGDLQEEETSEEVKDSGDSGGNTDSGSADDEDVKEKEKVGGDSDSNSGAAPTVEVEVVVDIVKNDALKARLASQSELLVLVLDVVGSSGIVKDSDHAHTMFCNGFESLLQ